MDSASQKSNEGIRACLHALQLAEQAVLAHKPDSVNSVRRLGRSLQRVPFALEDPSLAKALTDLQAAEDHEIPQRLQKLLPRLIELTTQRTALTYTILLIEDDSLTAQILEKKLTAMDREIEVVHTLKEAEAFLAQKDPSLVLLDLVLPDGDGRDLLMRLRSNPATEHVPIIVISSKQDSHAKTECFALGADAYFEKPVEPNTLSTAVAVTLQRSVDNAQQSSLDTLTRLPNRSVFYHAFARATRLASRNHEPLVVAILDLDRFKAVNDLSGHEMGDRVLKKISALLLRTLRASDLLVRWGGEEFAILFPNTNLSQARVALNKALSNIRKHTFKTPEGRVFKMTFSAGLSQVEPGMGVEQAMGDADRYLYLAKSAGRNHVLSKEDRLDNLKRNILLVEDDDFMASLLRRFLEKEDFRIFHAQTGKIALSLCSQAAFSLITLDVKLPDADGFELLEQLRKIPMVHHVPIMMLTATGNEENVIRGFNLGADDYIIKPFSPSQFLARVRRLLEKQA